MSESTTTMMAASSSSTKAPVVDFGVVFDIDGVLVRGGQALKGARDVLLSLRGRNVPHIYLTNNGGVLEDLKAKQIGKLLELEIDPKHMVLSHTPMRDLVENFGDRRVLLLGCSDVVNVARTYGFTKIVTVQDLVHQYPGQFAFRQYQQRQAPFDGEPIDAIIVMHDPIDWAVELQVVIDVLIGGDPPGSGRADGSQTPIFASNDDFLFSSTYAHPRFAQGAFTICLKELYKARTGKELKITKYGKPKAVAYNYAEKLLNQVAGRDAASPLKRIYMIGDNPYSDIQGANSAGDHWSSILVRTGIYDGLQEPEHRPDVHAATVKEALDHIYDAHGLPPL